MEEPSHAAQGQGVQEDFPKMLVPALSSGEWVEFS